MKRELDLEDWLRQHKILPSSQRLAVAEVVMNAMDEHPSADKVWSQVRRKMPTVSRATVYNTLNLFVEKGLVKAFELAGGHLVYDANVYPHHHFIDDRTGRIHDLPWEALEVKKIEALKGVDVREWQVVVYGRSRG